jgi:predicted amidohydrolase YtcJ
MSRIPRGIKALSIKDGRIDVLGKNPQEVKQKAAPGSEILSFPSGRVLPGFWDTHVHVERIGRFGDACLLYTATSIAEICESLTANAAANPQAPVIAGRAGCLHPSMLGEGRMLTRVDLDKIDSRRPIAIFDVNKIVANSPALAAAGVNRETPDPPGGSIDRDANGEPTGVCRFLGAMNMFSEVLALRPVITGEKFEQYFEQGCRLMAEQGFTTFIQAYANTEQIRSIEKLDVAGRLDCRVIIQPAAVLPGQLEEFLESGYSFRQQLGPCSQIGPVKLFHDLFVMHRSARLGRPYIGMSGNQGLYHSSPEEVAHRQKLALDHGFPVGIHVTGQAGLDEALDSLVAELDSRGSAAPEGSFMIHGYFPGPGVPERMASYSLGLAAQPIFLYAWADELSTLVGPELVEDFYPLDRFLEAGVKVGGGSDGPIACSNPFYSIYAATARKSASGRVWGAEHALDIETALELYSCRAAELVPWSGLSGCLASGQPADFVVLDCDPRQVPAEELPAVKVQATYLAGRRTYSSSREQQGDV